MKNRRRTSGRVHVSPLLQSMRFSDFDGVPAGAVELELAPLGEAEATIHAGPFLDDDVRGKHYAIGRGDYTVTRVRLEPAGGPGGTDADFSGRDFTIGASKAVFTAVVYDQAYFDRLRFAAGAQAWMRQAFAHPSEVFRPDAPGASTGTYTAFPGGFDRMMDLEQHYRVFSGFSASSAAGGFCEQADAYAKTALGLARDWNIGDAPTNPDHHGFDVLVGLTPAMVGGATCGWLGTQVSGLFDFDLSIGRSEMILVHEMGHIFGAPHCDPLQGFLMCSGENAEHYTNGNLFVWHQSSRDAMTNRYD